MAGAPGKAALLQGRELALASDRLASDGYVFLPALCDRAFTRHILSIARARIAEARAALGDREIGIGSAAGFEEIVQRSPGRWDLPISPRRYGTNDRDLPWWPLITAVLGDDAEHSFSGVVFSDTGSPAQYWHIDSPHVSPEHLPAHAVNVLVALHDMTMEMGPTEIARGSQFMTNHLSNPRLVPDQLVYQHDATSPVTIVAGTDREVPDCEAPVPVAGSCLVFDDRILHRGLGNRSGRYRVGAQGPGVCQCGL